MASNDPLIAPVGAQNGTTVVIQPSALPPEQPKQPGKFARIFGAVLGGAVNMVAPGVGGLLGGLFGRGGVDFTNMQAMLEQQQWMAMQMLAIQQRVQTQTQEFTTVSNLLKARHDGEMSAIHNFKS